MAHRFIKEIWGLDLGEWKLIEHFELGKFYETSYRKITCGNIQEWWPFQTSPLEE